MEFIEYTLGRILCQMCSLNYCIWSDFLHAHSLKNDGFHDIFIQYITCINELHPLAIPIFLSTILLGPYPLSNSPLYCHLYNQFITLSETYVLYKWLQLIPSCLQPSIECLLYSLSQKWYSRQRLIKSFIQNVLLPAITYLQLSPEWKKKKRIIGFHRIHIAQGEN